LRILRRKIWRAFPELDKYDDDVCQRYIHRAKRIDNSWKGWVLIFLTLPVAFIVWGVLSWMGSVFIAGLEYQHDIYLTDSFSIFFPLVVLTGFAWFPLVSAFIVRDRWLNRCIRKQLSGIKCGACGYSLIGLSLIDEAPNPTVICPECGHHILLHEMGLTHADIDPSLLAGP
jgi:DNA-directed RNA polymerase subunit RPC12/RpoP